MRWKRYPAYKDSGVEWLGEVPEHWGVSQLRWVLLLNDGGTWGEDPENDEDGTIVLRSTELGVDGSWDIEGAARRKLNLTDVFRKRLLLGDVVVTKSSGSIAHIGKTGFVTTDIEELGCCFSNFMQRLRPDRRLVSRFLFWFLNGTVGREQMFFLANNTTGLRNLSESSISGLRISLPCEKEQNAISSFLDRQTERIDNLIAKKQRQIEILEEKRTALITHAVTKGLDSEVKMKDSGVEWLGEVPEHWNVTKLKQISHLQTGPFGSQLHASDYSDNGTPLVNPAQIKDGRVVPDPAISVSQDSIARLERHRLILGDLVMGRRGEMGRLALITKEEHGFLCGTGSIRIRPIPDFVDSGYLAHALRTPGIRDHLLLESVGSTMDNLNTAILGNTPVPLPPKEEQARINASIIQLITADDRMREAVVKSFRLLREYRSALIAAAVTGQIDVREEA